MPGYLTEKLKIEYKGRTNESVPIRWKKFKKNVKERIPHVNIYKPKNQNECDKVVELILTNKLN